jgi:hypothetical protein
MAKLTSIWVAPASLAVGLSLVSAPLRVLGMALALVGLAAAFLMPRTWLPGLALCAYALIPTAYLSLPQAFGRFLTPAVIVLFVWACRTLWDGLDERQPLPRYWWLVSAAFCIWIVALTFESAHRMRSALWCVVVVATIVLGGGAAARSPHVRNTLLKTWTALAIVLGAAGTLEGVTHLNPLASHYEINGQAIRQVWSVYRIETTLGHPVANAMFFATTAAVMVVRAMVRPSMMRLAAALLSTSALTFTASRAGVLGLAIGVGVSLIALTVASSASLGRKILIAGALVAVVWGASQAPMLVKRESSSEGQASSVYRSQVLHTAFSVMRSGHYVGSGPGTSQDTVTEAGGSLTIESSPLQLGISIGLPGLVLFALLVGFAGAAAIRAERWESVAGLIACVTGASAFNAWDSAPESLALLALVMLTCLASRREDASAPSRTQTRAALSVDGRYWLPHSAERGRPGPPWTAQRQR